MELTRIKRAPEIAFTPAIANWVGDLADNTVEVLDLRRAISELCSETSTICSSQIMPENALLQNCISTTISGPSFLEVLPTDVCNHGCHWCFTAQNRTTRVLNPKRLKERLNQFVSQGGKAILFSGGGEPLLYKPLSERTCEFDDLTVVEWLANQNVTVGLITNGVYLDRFIRANASCLSAVAFIRVSLDAYTAASYQLLHAAKEGDFASVEQGIKSAIAQRGGRATPAVGISFVVDGSTGMNATPADLSAIRRHGFELGVDFIQLKHAHTRNQIQADNLMQSMSQWSEILPQYRVELWIHRYLSSSAESQCVVPMVAQVLNSDASRSPCCHLQGVSMPSLELAEGFAPFTVKGCKSSVCRYVSMNRMLREAARTRSAHIAALERLKQSLKQCGFHPYRLFPSAPDLAGAQSILMASR